MTWNERAKELRKDPRALWEKEPDNKDFKPFRPIALINAFLCGLMVLTYVLLNIDYDKVDYLADLYRDKLILFALYHPLEVGVVCVIFVVMGCAWLVKRAMS